MSQPDVFSLSAVHARRLAGRRRFRRTCAALVVALTCGVVVAQFRAVDVARRRWSDTRVVAVARHDLAPGDTVDAGSVVRREVASGSVTPAALDDVPDGAVVRYPVAEGEPLIAERLAPEGLTGVAARVPAGERAVALPVAPATRPSLRAGDRVDVLAVAVSDDMSLVGSVAPLVDRALVVDVRDESVTVAVPASLAPTVAEAVAQGAVVVTLAGA